MKYHILLPTDFSDNAYNAALYALNLYTNESCTFYLLHTWTFSNSGSRTYITTNYVDTLKEETKKRLDKLKDQLKIISINNDHKFETINSSDPLLNIIKTAVEEYKINLVIMGTKGATGAKEFLFGSNTVTIINKLRLCPVLVVPDAFNYVEPKKIAFPTDFNRFYGEELLHIKHLAKLHNSKISILHVNEKENLKEKQNYNLAMLKAYLEDYRHRFHWMTGFDKKEEAIKVFIEELDINILTMINYKHSFIEGLINEPIIRNIGFHSVIPFLVIPSSD